MASEGSTFAIESCDSVVASSPDEGVSLEPASVRHLEDLRSDLQSPRIVFVLNGLALGLSSSS